MRKLLIFLTISLFPVMCTSSETTAQNLQLVLDQLQIKASVDDLKPAPIEGFKEVVRGLQVLYVADDGSLLIKGDVLSISGESNLTELRRAEIRRGLLADIPLDQRLVSPVLGQRRGVITVFVDTNCTYCMKLHHQAAELARQGIEVQYLFYPRSGQAGESFAQAVSVWCSADRLAALGAVMNGKELPVTECSNPVKGHYQLARQLELRGTPAIIYADGEVSYGVPDLVKSTHVDVTVFRDAGDSSHRQLSEDRPETQQSWSGPIT
ncbi:MAG: DsbC family protein, partial [Xanthomonadales bacterium]|nr:DsbC family protein [Xanthomonadales bacterium]